MNLSNFEKLHQSIGLPSELVNNQLSGIMHCTVHNLNLLKECATSRHCRITEISMNNKSIDIEDIDNVIACNSEMTVSIKILQSENSLIFKNINDLLTRRLSLSNGDKIEDFYFYSTGESSKIGKGLILKNKLDSICELINGLADLAHYHDKKSGTDKPSYVFVNESDISNGRPLVIETSITEEMLLSPLIDISVFSDFSSSSSTNPNIGREKSVFRATLIEYLKNKPLNESEFNTLIQGWNDFLILFRKNFDTYISGFAFHKVRQEVANAELTIANELSKIMGEIGGKVLGVPISMVAIIPIVNSNSIFESLIITLGLVITSIISSQVIFNQQNQLERVIDAKKIMFPSEEIKNSQHPDFLKTLVTTASEKLDLNQSKINITLWFFRVICWLPALFSIIVFYSLYGNNFEREIFISTVSFSATIILILKNRKIREKIFLKFNKD